MPKSKNGWVGDLEFQSRAVGGKKGRQGRLLSWCDKGVLHKVSYCSSGLNNQQKLQRQLTMFVKQRGYRGQPEGVLAST
jgi:hypothetical protein